MKFRVIDFETTGDERTKRDGRPVGICEIGLTDLHYDAGEVRISRPYAAFVNPGHSMPPEARAVHHITDDDLVGAMDPTSALRTLMDGMEPGDMFAAHNAAFERALFGGGSLPWVCTMICAKHLCEDAPSFSNQGLRYYLGIDAEFEWPEMAMPPHRAGPDSYVTAHILGRLLVSQSPGQLIRLTTTPVLQKKVNFGTKHRGQPWSEMDAGFLQWVLDKDFDDETKATARHWLSKHRQAGNPFGN